MAHAGRIRDDCIRHERRLSSLVLPDTRLPATLQHLGEHVSLPANVTGFDAGEAGDQTGILDNIRHELCRVTTQGVELQSSGAHKVFEDTVSCEAHPVIVVALQSAAQCDKRLYIASTAGNLEHDVESRWWRG